jgi:hypothetical protein
MTGLKQQRLLSFLQVGLFVGIFALFFNPAYLFHDNIKGDDASYVAHSFTIALDGDLNYCNEVGFDQKGCAEGLSRTAPPHPIGTGIVHAPLVRIFSIFDILGNHPVIKDRQRYIGSWSFFGMFISTSCCFVFGLLLFIWAIESITPSIPRWLILLFAFGYGVPYYIFQRFTMSHGPEFFFLAVVFWSTIRLMAAEGREKYLWLSVLPVAIGMSYLIRPANICVLFAPPLVFMLASNITGVKSTLLNSFNERICLISVSLIVTLIIISLNNNLYGSYFPDARQMYGRPIGRIPVTVGDKANELVNSLKYIPTLIFSSEFGLIFSAPVLVFGTLAAFFLGIGRRTVSLRILYLCCFLVCFGVPLAVVLFWKNTGDAYGYRYLFSIAPVCIMGLVLFYHKYPGRKHALLKNAFLVLIAFAMLGQIFFASSAALTPSKKVNAFGRLEKFSANGYERSLLKSATQVNGWGNMMAKRYPGFLLVQVLNEHQVRQMAQQLKLPADKFEEVFRNMNNSSLAYRFSIAIYGLLMPFVFWFMVRNKKSSFEGGD